MKITIQAKVDFDVKNTICQTLSRYKKVLDKLRCVLRPYESSIELQQMIEMKESVFNEIKATGDDANDIIGIALLAFSDPRISSINEEQKRRIFPWYDSVFSWAHDSRAFIQKIYAIVDGGNYRYVLTDDVHSLVALQSALYTMFQCVWNNICDNNGSNECVCEIYKVFDKFKRCYRSDQAAFVKKPLSFLEKFVV